MLSICNSLISIEKCKVEKKQSTKYFSIKGTPMHWTHVLVTKLNLWTKYSKGFKIKKNVVILKMEMSQ